MSDKIWAHAAGAGAEGASDGVEPGVYSAQADADRASQGARACGLLAPGSLAEPQQTLQTCLSLEGEESVSCTAFCMMTACRLGRGDQGIPCPCCYTPDTLLSCYSV